MNLFRLLLQNDRLKTKLNNSFSKSLLRSLQEYMLVIFSSLTFRKTASRDIILHDFPLAFAVTSSGDQDMALISGCPGDCRHQWQVLSAHLCKGWIVSIREICERVVLPLPDYTCLLTNKDTSCFLWLVGPLFLSRFLGLEVAPALIW